MSYRFHKCQPHAKLPKLTGWYLELRPDDPETMLLVHKGITFLYFYTFVKDPYTDQQIVYNPLKLAAQWLCTVERYLLRKEILLVNCNGGIMPLDGTIVLETIESDNIRWNERFDDEIITVSQWPKGKHWYLSSSKRRLFVPEKYDNFNEAHREALRYVPAEHIKVQENRGSLPPE